MRRKINKKPVGNTTSHDNMKSAKFKLSTAEIKYQDILSRCAKI